MRVCSLTCLATVILAACSSGPNEARSTAAGGSGTTSRNSTSGTTGTATTSASATTSGSSSGGTTACPWDMPNLFTGETDQGGVCGPLNRCATGLSCVDAGCWLDGEQSPIQIVLSWSVTQDLDLHVVEPEAGGPDTETLPDGGSVQGCEIYYGRGLEGMADAGPVNGCQPVGRLSRDSQAICSATDTDIEEVTYPVGQLPPAGWYTVRADLWTDCDNGATALIPFGVQVRIGNQVRTYCGSFTPAQADQGNEGSGTTIFQFEMLPDGGSL